MDHEGTAAQPVGDPGVAGTRASDADVPVLHEPVVDRTPPEDAQVQDGASDVEAQVDGLLAEVQELPLREQVDVFESVHAVLTDRLNEKDA